MFNIDDNAMKMCKTNRGMTMVETLIVLVISFAVLAAIFKIFVSAKENMLLQDNLARMQENARVAIQALQEDIRMAGFMGEIQEYWNIEFAATQTVPATITNECFNDTGAAGFRWIAPFVSIGNNPPAIPPKLAGQEDDESYFSNCFPGSAPSHRAGTDVLTVHYVGPEAVIGIPANNTYYLRANLFNALVFRSTGVAAPSTGGSPAIAYSSGPNDQIFPIKARTYYVSSSETDPALVRVELASDGAVVTNPVADGVVSMHILYGIDTDNPADGVANRYEDAGNALLGNFRTPANWPRWADVKTVRIWLLMRSQDRFAGYTDPVGASYTLAVNDPAPVSAGYRYQMFVTTIAVRNASGDEP